MELSPASIQPFSTAAESEFVWELIQLACIDLNGAEPSKLADLLYSCGDLFHLDRKLISIRVDWSGAQDAYSPSLQLPRVMSCGTDFEF